MTNIFQDNPVRYFLMVAITKKIVHETYMHTAFKNPITWRNAFLDMDMMKKEYTHLFFL